MPHVATSGFADNGTPGNGLSKIKGPKARPMTASEKKIEKERNTPKRNVPRG